VSGTYEVDASFDSPAPTIKQGSTVIATGIFYDPTPADTANRDEIAVFTFDTIDLPAGVTLAGLGNANSRPVALLSRDAVTVAGVIDFSGGNADISDSIPGFPGGAAGPGGGGGGGGGPADGASGGSGGAGYVPGQLARTGMIARAGLVGASNRAAVDPLLPTPQEEELSEEMEAVSRAGFLGAQPMAT
jgi:hypothetical protein